MEDGLANPIQSKENDVRIDIKPKMFYGEDISSQTIKLPDGNIFPMAYDNVLPYFTVRKPTSEEIDECDNLELTSRFDWDPYTKEGLFSLLETDIYEYTHISALDTISDELMSCRLSLIAYNFPFLHNYSVQAAVSLLEYEPEESFYIHTIKTSNKYTLTPYMLSKMWNIGLPTSARTITATTHKNIRSTGLLSRRFKTNQYQFWYKQLSLNHGTFFVYFLKSIVKLIRGFMVGTIYCNTLGFNKLFPCSLETQDQTEAGLCSFI